MKERFASELLVLLFCGLNGCCYASAEQYNYRLEESQDKGVCEHMTEVFNRNFKTPWDRGGVTLSSNPTFFNRPYDKIFTRLPGVEYSKDFVFRMLLARYPSSTEFDAVIWNEGRVYYPDSAKPGALRESPILVTQIDIDNDGKKEWVVKADFMQRPPTNHVSDAGDYDYTGSDSVIIFPVGGFDSTVPLMSKELVYGQKPGYAPRKLDDDETLQLRPFIYKGITYVAAYQVVWDKKRGQNDPRGNSTYPDFAPDKEYLNVARVIGGGKNPNNLFIETANSETLCRIRMIRLNDSTSSQGK